LSKKPIILLLAVLITAIQATILAGFAVLSVIYILAGGVLSLVSALFLTGMLLAASAFMINVAIGMFRLKRWAYTPSFVLQLLIVSIGVASFSGEFGVVAIGVALSVPAAIVFFAMFSKNVRELFRGQ
jgi:hypothetical protein